MSEFDHPRLAAWLERHGFTVARFQPLAGDVSARRYARLDLGDGRSAIASFYPDELHESCERFLRSTRLLEGIGVRVPGVLASDCGRGLMLLEDAGARTLYELGERPHAELAPYYETAIDIAARIAGLRPDSVAELNPPLDATLLRRELEQTVEVFLAPSGRLGDPATRAEILRALDRLCERLGDAPQAPCHRDFMSRNLVPGDGAEVTVLDHQDIRLGPPGYDLASLLNDSFYPPHEIESRWLAPLLPTARDRRRYHRAAAQRTLKAIGTFAAFAARGVDRHLRLIEPTLARARHHLARTPEASDLAPTLERLWGSPR